MLVDTSTIGKTVQSLQVSLMVTFVRHTTILLTFMLISVLANADFRLPEGNYVSAKMPMHVVFPRPDSETQPHARHRWAHPSMQYRIPIGIQGGAWPFKYELVDAPEGAVIGSLYGSGDYGEITWQPQQAGVYNFTVKVTDQDLNTVTASWEVTVDANQFVFIQDGWQGAKVGTINQPLEDIADWYRNSPIDNTYHNKIVVLRGGSYKLLGGPSTNNNVRLEESTKTPSIIAFPGELPIVDSSQSKMINGNSGLKDAFIAGIRWENSRQDVANAHFHWATGDVTRGTWWDNEFYNHGPGTAGNDNTSAVFISNTSTHKKNILYKNNHHEKFNTLGKNSSYVDVYYSSYVLVEGNTAKNSATSYGFWAKATTSFVTIRANKAFENISGGGISVGYTSSGKKIPHDHEVCWNNIVVQPNNNNQTVLLWADGMFYKEKSYNSYIYRNSFINGSSWVRFKGAENYKVDGNVVITNLPARWGKDIMTTLIANVLGRELDGVTDTNGNLIDSYRKLYIGKAGHEISTLDRTPNPPESISVQ